MTELMLAAVLGALAVAVWLRTPATAMSRLQPRARRTLPGWLTAELGPRKVSREEKELIAELPEALEFLAVSLEAGQPMSAAVETVARVSPPATGRLLREVAAQLALGRAGPDAWQHLKEHAVWGRIAADMARSERSGTSLTGVLKVHAEDARQDSRDQALKAARTVGVRSVIPLMACFLPAFILIGVVPIVAGLIKGFFAG